MVKTLTEQEQVPNEEELTKEVITYTKTMTDEGVSVQQLADDPEKLSIDDGRWVIDIPKKFAICVSEEFEQTAVACTHLNQTEWGGFIVGHDIKWTNPENQRQIRILVAERAVILGQTRTGASFEIKEDVVEKWMDSDDEFDMSFKTVYAKNRWKKIGWVHSHGDLGTFWSKTDTDTMEDMRSVPMLLSIVCSRTKDNKVEKWIRVDQNDAFFGGKFNMSKDGIEDSFIYVEGGKIESVDEVPEEIREKYLEILNATVVIDTTSHTKTKTTTTVSSANKTWYQQSAARYGQAFSGKDTTEQLSKHTVVVGDLSEKAKEEIVAFGNFHYNLPENARKSLSIADFFILLSNDLVNQMKPDGLYKKWKMKDIVALLDKQQILEVISFYKNSEITVQLAMQAYHNFEDFSKSAINLIANKLQKNAELKTEIEDVAGIDWEFFVLSALTEKATVVLDIDDVEKIAEEAKPLAYMPTETFTDWTEWYTALPKKYHADLWDTIFGTLQDEKLRKKMLERGEYAVTLEIRGDEDEWLGYAVSTYENLVDMWEKTPKRYKEMYRNFYTAFYRNAFKPYFSKYKYYNEKHSKLQKIVNALPEDYVKQFVNDFIVSYETSEELEAIVEKYPTDFEVHKQTFLCGLCGIEWTLKADAESCEESCKKRGKTTSKEVDEITVDSTVKKATEWKEEKSLTALFGGRTIMDDTMKSLATFDVVFGTTVKYYEGLNVCDFCGTLYDTEEAAKLCAEECGGILDDVKEYFIDKDGLYECPYCKTQYFDDVPALGHTEECPQYGAILNYLLHLMCDEAHSKDIVMNVINNHYLNKPGTPAPIMDWMLDKGSSGNDMFVCDVCGVESAANEDTKDRVIQAFSHMNYCNIEDKKGLVRWNGTAFQCGLCGDRNYLFSTAQAVVMKGHFYIRHGLYPTLEQMGKNLKSRPVLTQAEYVGETTHAILLEDGFCCKECGEKFIRPDSILNHMTHTHTCVIVHGEYEQWTEHDQDIDLVLFGSLPTYPAPERNLPKEVITTENVNSYNGIFVCKHCEMTVGTITGMKEHVLEKHEIHMTPDEELVMFDYEKRYKNQQKEEEKVVSAETPEYHADEFVFESLDELFADWLMERTANVSPQTKCESCGVEFTESDSEVMNTWHTFIHEVDCCELTGVGIEAYTCGLCGSICKTIFEREICEESHMDEV